MAPHNYTITERAFNMAKKFLITNNINDFRISLGLWGATFGFAAIPKTLTQDFLLSNSNYTISFSSRLAKQLFNYEIITTSGINVENEPQYYSIPHENVAIEDFKNELPRTRAVEVLKQNNTTFEAELRVTSPKEVRGDQERLIDPTAKILCPQCNSEMKLINGQYGEFYGCIRYPSCKGKRHLKEENKFKSENNRLPALIKEFVEKNGNCKTSDLLLFVNNKTKNSYNVNSIEKYIKQNLINELEIIKIGRASGVAKRGNEFFS
jgi:ssDNA-binding Zn-finger/Zn-ribbon topoisomerase 1